MSAFQNEVAHECIDHAASWIVDDSLCEIRCIEYVNEDGIAIQDASLTLGPPFTSLHSDNDLELSVKALCATQRSRSNVGREAAIALVKDACAGTLQLGNKTAQLKIAEPGIDIHSESQVRDRWAFPHRFRVSGDRLRYLSALEAMRLDDSLRSGEPPFDGIGELAQWLDLKAAIDGTSASGITVTVLPPVELLFNECSMNSSTLSIKVRLAAKASIDQLGIAVRLTSGRVHTARMQIAHKTAWTSQSNEQLLGSISLSTADSVGAQVLVTYSGRTVIRQWFWDLSKSPSPRYHSLNQFDPDLKGLKNALFTSTESRDFEKAVGCVAYLIGLSSALPLQSKTPDLVASTPKGRHLVIECTLAISDFSTKLGKLVDRCNALRKCFAEATLTMEVFGVLVCRLPHDQIAKRDGELQKHRILLATKENLDYIVNRAWQAQDPDALLDAAIAMSSAQHLPGPSEFR